MRGLLVSGMVCLLMLAGCLDATSESGAFQDGEPGRSGSPVGRTDVWRNASDWFQIQVPIGPEGPVKAFEVTVPEGVVAEEGDRFRGGVQFLTYEVVQGDRAPAEGWFMAAFRVGDEAAILGHHVQQDITVWKGLDMNARQPEIKNGELHLLFGEVEAGDRLVIVAGGTGARDTLSVALRSGTVPVSELPNLKAVAQAAPYAKHVGSATGWARHLYFDISGAAVVHANNHGAGLASEGVRYEDLYTDQPVGRNDVIQDRVGSLWDRDGWIFIDGQVIAHAQTGTWTASGTLFGDDIDQERVISMNPPGFVAYELPDGGDLVNFSTIRVVAEGTGGVDFWLGRTLAGVNSPSNVLGYSALIIGSPLEELIGAPALEMMQINDRLEENLADHR